MSGAILLAADRLSLAKSGSFSRSGHEEVRLAGTSDACLAVTAVVWLFAGESDLRNAENNKDKSFTFFLIKRGENAHAALHDYNS